LGKTGGTILKKEGLPLVVERKKKHAHGPNSATKRCSGGKGFEGLRTGKPGREEDAGRGETNAARKEGKTQQVDQSS